MITLFQFSRMLDATLSHAGATMDETLELIELAKHYHFYSIIGPRCYVPLMEESLKGTDTIVGAGCSFPAGHDPTVIKAAYAKLLVEQGAKEIDMVLNIGFLKSKMYQEAEADILAVKGAIGESIPLKCIIETPVLIDHEIREASHMVLDSGIEYIKTATGFQGKTTIQHVKILSEEIRGKIKIKASGGIKNSEAISQMLDLGVSRFGISLTNVMKIIEELQNE